MANQALLRICVLLLVAGAVQTAPAAARASADQLPPAITDQDFRAPASDELVELGRLLFFDKMLSGNQNISCATCHHPRFATGDGVSLPLGEGALGVGPTRHVGHGKHSAVHNRVARNSQALFNLGAREYTRMFHDGRVEVDVNGYYKSGFITPARWKLPTGLQNVLAAQAMFPVIASDEMAGQRGENPIADAVALNNAAKPGGAWDLIARRLREIPEYVERFRRAFPDRVREASDFTMVDIANAVAAFEGTAFRSDQSPFDDYLRGSGGLGDFALRGLRLFYGRAGCSACHSGRFQTDHEFHAIAMPQLGPGKRDGADASYWRGSGFKTYIEDFGRGRVTFRPEDNFKFRTPSLRNVDHTGPWGHAGAYATLEAVVRHHLDPVRTLETYETTQARLPDLGTPLEITATGSRLNMRWLSGARRRGFALRDFWVQRQEAMRQRIANANELRALSLSDREVDDLIAFLHSLTDRNLDRIAALVPDTVPSGLPVDH